MQDVTVHESDLLKGAIITTPFASARVPANHGQWAPPESQLCYNTPNPQQAQPHQAPEDPSAPQTTPAHTPCAWTLTSTL